MSSAWPVPSATTRTSMPLACLKAGSRWANRPDCSVEVVEAITMARSCAAAGASAPTAMPRATPKPIIQPRRAAMRFNAMATLL